MANRKVQLFLRFAKLGFLTIGGGYAMVPLIEREIVDRCRWMSREEYYRALTLSQSVPGAVAVNVALATGMRVEGTVGALLAALGVILPSFACILAIAMSFASFRSLPVVEAVFRGIRPVLVSLIAVSAVRTARRERGAFTYVTAAIGFLTLQFLELSPFLLVLLSVAAGMGRALIKRRGVPPAGA